MATEFNYVVNVDTTRVMGAMSEVRSQIGMALGGATGFGGAGGLTGGGSDFSGGASAAFGRMMGGMGGGVKFGTFTNEAMSYMPHHGMVQAHTTLEQERSINQGGVSAAAAFKPPGVSAAEFAMGVQSNFIDRNITAQQAATSAAKSSFYAGVGGLAAGEGLSKLAGVPIGGMVGGAIAKRMGGLGAMKTGKMLGGFAGMMAAYTLADDVVGGAIRGHYAEKEMTEGITKELGEIAGAGRGLSRTKKYDLGAAAMGAAKDLDMGVQEMGNILALGRQSGMLPTGGTGGADAGKAKQQFTDFARAVEEGAQILHTSLAGATQVIKTATSKGMTAEQGIMGASAAGGAGEWLQQQAQMSAFGSAGAAAGRGMGFTGAQGRGVYMGGLGGKGLSGEEMKIMGGRFGSASFVGSTQMAMAKGPMGDMQLMAAMSGEGGGSMMDLPGQAMAAMSQGGDFLSNMGKFMVHKDEYRRGIGPKGIQTMAKQQLSGLGDVIQEMMPGMSKNEAQRFAAQSMGMSPDQAKTLVGGTSGGGGGGGGGGVSRGALGRARQMVGIQGSALSDMASGVESVESRMSGSGAFGEVTFGGVMRNAATGAGLGAIAASPTGPGALVGAAWGAAGSLAIDAGRAIGNLFTGPDSAREAGQAYDAAIAKAKKKVGFVDVDIAQAYAFQTADLRGAQLDITSAGGGGLGPAMGATMDAMGYSEVTGGAGTFYAGGGKYYSNKDAQDAVNKSRAATKPLNRKQQNEAALVAYDTMYTEEGRAAVGGTKGALAEARLARTALARLEVGSDKKFSKEIREKYNLEKDDNVSLERAGLQLKESASLLLEGAADASTDKKVGAKLRKASRAKGAINNTFVREVLGSLIGADVEKQDVLTNVLRGGALSADEMVTKEKANRVAYLTEQYPLTVDPKTMGSKQYEKWRDRHVEKLLDGDGLAGTGTYGPEEQIRAPTKVMEDLWRRATEMPEWKSDPTKAAKLAQVAMGDEGKGFKIPTIDADEKIMKRGAMGRSKAASAMSSVAKAMGFGGIAEDFADRSKKFLESASINELEEGTAMASADSVEAKQDKIRKPRKGAQRAVGWGAQEESMNLINKSLKRTHKMLSVLEKKMGGSTPAGGAETS